MGDPAVSTPVHYVEPPGPGEGDDPVCRAALVTRRDRFPEKNEHADECWLDLAVFAPAGIAFPLTVPRDEAEHRPGSWHLPDHDHDAHDPVPDPAVLGLAEEEIGHG